MSDSVLVPTRATTSRPASTLAVSAVAGGVFAVLALLVAMKWSPLLAFDRDRLVQLNHLDGHRRLFLDTMRAVSAVASTIGWLVVLGTVTVWLLGHRRWRAAVFVAVTSTGSSLLNAVLKDVVRRPRSALAHPVEVASGWSFPSGHTQAATVGCAVMLVVFLPSRGRTAARWAVAAAVVVVMAVALSRMSLGVHYPSDVTAAVLCALAWTFLAAWILGVAVPLPARNQVLR